jgi:hypothetical protein
MHGTAFDGVISKKMTICFLMALKHAWCSPGRVSYMKEGIVMDIAFRFSYPMCHRVAISTSICYFQGRVTFAGILRAADVEMCESPEQSSESKDQNAYQGGRKSSSSDKSKGKSTDRLTQYFNDLRDCYTAGPSSLPLFSLSTVLCKAAILCRYSILLWRTGERELKSVVARGFGEGLKPRR